MGLNPPNYHITKKNVLHLNNLSFKLWWELNVVSSSLSKVIFISLDHKRFSIIKLCPWQVTFFINNLMLSTVSFISPIKIHGIKDNSNNFTSDFELGQFTIIQGHNKLRGLNHWPRAIEFHNFGSGNHAQYNHAYNISYIFTIFAIEPHPTI